MPDRPTCKDCRFWDSGTNIGTCRANAPVAGPHIHEENAQAMWPRTEETDWCGKHEPHGSETSADIPPELAALVEDWKKIYA